MPDLSLEEDVGLFSFPFFSLAFSLFKSSLSGVPKKVEPDSLTNIKLL